MLGKLVVSRNRPPPNRLTKLSGAAPYALSNQEGRGYPRDCLWRTSPSPLLQAHLMEFQGSQIGLFLCKRGNMSYLWIISDVSNPLRRAFKAQLSSKGDRSKIARRQILRTLEQAAEHLHWEVNCPPSQPVA